MSRALIALVACAAVSPALGQSDDAPQTGVAPAETLVRLSTTRFQAVNLSGVDRLLLFRDATGEILATAALPPGGVLDSTFAPGTTEGLALEVVDVHPEQLLRGPLVPMEFPVTQPDDALWIQGSADHTCTWVQSGEALVPYRLYGPAGVDGPREFDEDALRDSHETEAMVGGGGSGTHTPVITPEPRPDDEPPDLDEDPLPPV